MANNTLPIVSKELAIMLKDAGFDWPVLKYYHPKYWLMDTPIEVGNMNAPNWANGYYSAPELPLVAQWLREVHGYHVCVDILNGEWYYDISVLHDFKSTEEVINNGEGFDSHDSALSAAIKYCLTKIKEDKK